MRQKFILTLISIAFSACTTEPEATDPSILTLDGQVEDRYGIVVYSDGRRVRYRIVDGISIPSDLNVPGRPVRFQFKLMWEMRNHGSSSDSIWAIKLISISLLPAKVPQLP